MNNSSFTLSGNIVDVFHMRIIEGTIEVENGRIRKISPTGQPTAATGSTGHKPQINADMPYILPGLVDAHIHVESSMLMPSEFARLAVVHGTVASVSDPHEIGNVLGLEGVRFMIKNGNKVPFKFCFGAPSCVPATPFETAGAEIGVAELEELLCMPEIGYLAEMMNYPGVLKGDPVVLAKLEMAKKYNKPIDGHAPGLRGKQASTYINAGISTDHECFTEEEALEKLALGMHILIREGSAARNFDALVGLLPEYADRVMFCSDDKHPNELVEGHINLLLARAVQAGIDPVVAIRTATRNPVEHYNLPVGLLRENDPADMVVVKDLNSFEVLGTWIDGQLVSEKNTSLLKHQPEAPINKFCCESINPEDLCIKRTGNKLRVITVEDGQLVTGCKVVELEKHGASNIFGGDTGIDVLKLVVINRYEKAKPAVAFVNNFSLKEGAIASSVGHDSHNVIAVGVSDEAICEAVNLIIENKGGISLVNNNVNEVLPLPLAGLMSVGDGYQVAEKYDEMDRLAKQMGSSLRAPFMSLSFLALLVIPELKLSDKGLFDGNKFEFVPPFL